jgi:3-mercaptopyruvate sulfurtransferase SseA
VSEIELDELSRRLGEVPVVDVRGAAEYDGSRGAHCDPRQGHIPGARNVSQLLRGLGYDARNYVGSWHEWSRTELPLETKGETR